MKAKLEFNLPDEKDDFYLASNGYKYRSVCWKMEQHFRELVKYNSLKLSESQMDIVETLRDYFSELLSSEGIDIYNDVS